MLWPRNLGRKEPILDSLLAGVLQCILCMAPATKQIHGATKGREGKAGKAGRQAGKQARHGKQSPKAAAERIRRL